MCKRLSCLFICALLLLSASCGVAQEGTVKEENSDKNCGEREMTLARPEGILNQEHSDSMRTADTQIPLNTELILEADAPSDVITPQGGCTDGAYFYQVYIFAQINQFLNTCRVVKYNLATGECVKQSELLQLNHANDMTYNSKKNCLVIAHNAPVANCITCLDPDTLEVVDHFSIDYFIFSIDYNEATDQYVIGLASSQTFCILNSDFEAVTEVFVPSERTEACITQGMAMDDEFIYFVLYKPNVVSVYDWDGNFVTLIELNEIAPLFYEPENISVTDGVMYIGCGCNGMNGGLDFCVFRLTGFVPKTDAEVNAE